MEGTASPQGQSALLVDSAPLLRLLGDAPGGYERGLARPGGDITEMLPRVAKSSP